MSEFEYLLFIIALLLSFAIARLVGGISHVLMPGRRDWIHTTWVIGTMGNIVLSWWIIYLYNDVEWTFLLFALWLVPTGMLLYVANALVPDDAKVVESWRDHWLAVRKGVLGANVIFALSVSLFNWIAIGDPTPNRVFGPLPAAALMAVGYRYGHPRVQGIVVAGYVMGVVMLMFQFNTR